MAFSCTTRQNDCLRFVAGFQQVKGYAPSLQEICEGLGISTKSSALRMLRGLEERGLIRRLPSHARAIEVLGDVALPRSPQGEPLRFIPMAFDVTGGPE